MLNANSDNGITLTKVLYGVLLEETTLLSYVKMTVIDGGLQTKLLIAQGLGILAQPRIRDR